jgi:hypothetical protein
MYHLSLQSGNDERSNVSARCFSGADADRSVSESASEFTGESVSGRVSARFGGAAAEYATSESSAFSTTSDSSTFSTTSESSSRFAGAADSRYDEHDDRPRVSAPVAFGETANTFNCSWRRPSKLRRRRRHTQRGDARPALGEERALWKRIAGDRACDRACVALRVGAVRLVSISVPVMNKNSAFMWLDVGTGWTASFAVVLVYDAGADSVRLRVSVVYSHFVRGTRSSETVEGNDSSDQVSALTPAPFWSRRRVRSRFVVADALLPDVPASFRWNHDADTLVVEALCRWKRIHRVLKACAVCGRLFGDDADVMCTLCATRRQCARWLDAGHRAPSPVSSFSMRECATLSSMDMLAEHRRCNSDNDGVGDDDDDDDGDDMVSMTCIA